MIAKTIIVQKKKKYKQDAALVGKQRYQVSFFNDGSGDNIPGIVEAMSKVDLKAQPYIKIGN